MLFRSDQVAEWYHNLTPVQNQVKILREICSYIQDQGELKGGHPQIYYSVENNTLGESALICIQNIGEENFPGLFLSEPIRKGHVRKFRKGFNTTFGTKIAICAKVKFMIEENKMTLNSKSLISELKTFIAHGASFKAKQGEHDDLVSSLLLVVRMSQLLAEWDPAVFERIKVPSNWDTGEDFEPPMPIFVSLGM